MTNLLVMQSGGSTHVLNRSLQGIVQEAEASGKFGQIMGARHALDGILNDSIVDLGRYDKKWWDRAGMTPGAILGSSRRKIRDGNVSKIHGVKMVFGEPDPQTGRASMNEVPESEFELDVDLILLAMGFVHPLQEGLLDDLGVNFDDRGNVKTDESLMTNINKIFEPLVINEKPKNNEDAIR